MNHLKTYSMLGDLIVIRYFYILIDICQFIPLNLPLSHFSYLYLLKNTHWLQIYNKSSITIKIGIFLKVIFYFSVIRQSNFSLGSEFYEFTFDF